MGEQAPPGHLVDDAVRAEAAGFDFAVVSDHNYRWLAEGTRGWRRSRLRSAPARTRRGALRAAG
ncbi:MAG TPA: hypothetical protein VES42_10355 [Pilimelia sp.]|nr:hypothetical protein [Pilimelia sp.]